MEIIKNRFLFFLSDKYLMREKSKGNVCISSSREKKTSIDDKLISFQSKGKAYFIFVINYIKKMF